MKLLFIYYTRFYKKESENKYYNRSFSKELLDRYFNLFSSIEMVSRIVITDKNIENLSAIEDKRVKFYDIPRYSIKNNKLDFIKNKEMNKLMIDRIGQTDAVIIRLPSPSGYKGLKILKKLNKKYIIELVGCPFDSLWNHGVIGKILAIPEYLRLRHIMGQEKNVIYVTKSFLQKRYPCKSNSLGCSDVIIDSITDNKVLEQREEKILKHNTNDLFIIGLIGHVESNIKGIDIAIKAIKELLRNNINVKLLILGNGNPSRWEKQIIRLGIKENIVFCGTIPSGAKVLDWLDRLDLYIQPSNQEGLPRAVVEAMSRGLPIVGSNVGGIPELLLEESIHMKKNYIDLYEKISFLLTNKVKMLEHSKINYNNSMNYLKEILDAKREIFMKEVFFSEK